MKLAIMSNHLLSFALSLPKVKLIIVDLMVFFFSVAK